MNTVFNRISAFLLDILLISFLTSSICSLGYLNPKKYDYEELTEQYSKQITEIMDDIENVKPNELINTTVDMVYDLEKSSIFNYVYYLVFVFLYFVLFQYFNKGQTLGKKLFKLKVVDKNGEDARFIQYIPRTLINGSSVYLGLNLMVLIKIILLLVVSKALVLYYLIFILSIVSYALEITLVVALIRNKDKSFNDIISGTKVIDLK